MFWINILHISISGSKWLKDGDKLVSSISLHIWSDNGDKIVPNKHLNSQTTLISSINLLHHLMFHSPQTHFTKGWRKKCCSEIWNHKTVRGICRKNANSATEWKCACVLQYYQANLLFSNITFKSKQEISINCIIEFLMFSFHLYIKNEVHVHNCSLSEAGIILRSPNPS